MNSVKNRPVGRDLDKILKKEIVTPSIEPNKTINRRYACNI